MRPRRIVHVITDLYLAGAETMLMRLAVVQPSLADETIVVSLLPDGFHTACLRAAGVTVVELNFRTAAGIVGGMLRLARLIAKTRPDIVQGWMYHGDLAALLALIMSGRRRATALAWNIRCSTLDFTRYGRQPAWSCGRARLTTARLVIANSTAGWRRTAPWAIAAARRGGGERHRGRRQSPIRRRAPTSGASSRSPTMCSWWRMWRASIR